MACVATVCLAVFMVISGQAYAVERDVSHDVRECRDDPRFGETGGAMIGDCLLEISEQVDAEIERVVARSAKAYCRQKDRDLLTRSQSDWQTYRQGFCELVERSPGNTPAYVNSAACMLSAGRKRLADLAYIVDYGQANCPFQKLLIKDSRFGNPAGVSVEMSSMPLTWKAGARDDKLTLEFRRNERSDDSLIGNVELTGCIFCPDGKEDCDDGVFFTETYGVNSANHSMFYVCHMADGARRLEQFHLSGTLGPLKEREVTEKHGFAWSMDLRELKVVPTNSARTLIWPGRTGDAR